MLSSESSLPDLSNLSDESWKKETDIVLRRAFQAYLNRYYSRALKLFQQYFRQGGEGAYARSIYSQALARHRRFDEALNEIKKARSFAPREVDYILLQAEILKIDGRLDQAFDFLKGFQYTLENEPGIEFYLGELSFHLGRYELANVHYLQTLFHIERAGERSFLYRKTSIQRIIQLHFRKGNYKEAENYLKTYIYLSERNAYFRFLLADFVYFRTGKYEQALVELEALWKYGPESFPAQKVSYQKIRRRIAFLLLQLYYFFEYPYFHSLASHISDLNILEQALRHTLQEGNETSLALLKNVVKKHPHSYIAWNAVLRVSKKLDRLPEYIQQLAWVGRLALRYGRYREGIGFIQEALELEAADADNEHTGAQLHLLYAAHYHLYKQYRRAALFVRKALDIKTKDRSAKSVPRRRLTNHLTYAELLSRPDPRQALIFLDTLAAEHPKDARIPSLGGRIYLAQNDFEKALTAFNRVIGLNAGNTDDILHRAYVHLRLRNYRSAHKDIDQVLQSKRHDSRVRNIKAYALALEGKELDKALQLILPVIQRQPTNGSYQDTLGWVYLKRKQLSHARYHLELAANLLRHFDSPNVDVLEHLGAAYQTMQRSDQARASYEEALQLIKNQETTKVQTKDREERKRKLRDKIMALKR